MSSRIKTENLEGNEKIIIPYEVRKTIAERGFYLYEWIGDKDVKESIERDFLGLLSNMGLVGAIFLVVPTALMYFIEGGFPYAVFGILITIINICFLGYILFLSIIRSNILRKNNQILITDSSISMNGNISQLDNYSIEKTSEIHKITTLFEEELFNSSSIFISKRKFQILVFEKIKNGYSSIVTKVDGRGKNGLSILIVLVGLYTLYILSVGMIYFIGIILIWFLGIIITIINKKILLATGHEITKINNSFENIDAYSKKLETEKDELITLLTDAQNNDWKDSLLTKINSGIELINNQANKAVNESIDLKKLIKNSKYSEMFNFGIYNSWIKKQILIPLEQIHDLLMQNINLLEKQVLDIDMQLSGELDSSKASALSMSKTRSIMKSEEIKKHIENMEVYIVKLK